MSTQSPKNVTVGYSLIESLFDGDRACPAANPKMLTQLIGTESFSGSSVSGFRDKIIKGTSASSSYTRHWYAVEGSNFHSGMFTKSQYNCSGKIASRSVFSSGNYEPKSFNFITPGVDAATDNLALTRLRARINEYTGNASLLAPVVELGELSKAGAPVKDAFAARLSQVSEWVGKATSKQKALSVLRRVADTHLSFAFGMRPLFQDVNDACRALAEWEADLDQRFTVRASASSSKSSSSVAKGVGFGYGSTGTKTAQSSVTLKRRYVCGLTNRKRHNTPYASLTNFNEQFGLALEDFVPTLWELMPYSWVIDYFANIGDVLNDTFVSSPSVRYGSSSFLWEERVTVVPTINPLPGHTGFGGGRSMVLVHGYYQRTSFSEVPPRSLMIRSPEQVASYGFSKVANLAAVVAKRNAKLR